VDVTSRHASFIDGRWQEPRGGEVDVVLSPATGEVVAEVARSSADDVDAAVAAAAAAFAGWAKTTPGERASALLKLADRVEGDEENLGRTHERHRLRYRSPAHLSGIRRRGPAWPSP
jgi:betaine-aldehyde dehydrogenase